MLNKPMLTHAYNSFLNEFRLTPEKVVVGFGGAMLMHGARQVTSDIDVEVEPPLMEWFEQRPDVRKSNFARPTGDVVKVLTVKHHPLIDIHYNNGCDASTTELINGVQVYTLEYCLKMKLLFNRPKDQKDIKTLQQMLDYREHIASIL